jgi:hypothetical protein
MISHLEFGWGWAAAATLKESYVEGLVLQAPMPDVVTLYVTV